MTEKKAKEKHTKGSKNKVLEEKEQRIGELTDMLQRLQAEFENYKRRIEGERASMASSASRNMVLKILPVLDNFELALKNNHAENDFSKGVEMIYAQLVQILNEEGVEIIDTVDKRFDPHFHEALLTEESEKDAGTILEELQKGYVMKGAVIRHAKVKVSK